MSASLIVVLVAVVGCVVFVWAYGQRPYRYRSVHVRDLKRFMENLLNRGYQGGLLILEPRSTRGDQRFLQFSKYIRQDGRAGLEFGFPRAAWSRLYYDDLCKELGASGVGFELQDTGREDTTQFLVVDLERDLMKAQRVAELAVGVVFGRADVSVQAHYENVSPLEVNIGV